MARGSDGAPVVVAVEAGRVGAALIVLTEAKAMTDLSDTDRTEPLPTPRLSVRFDSDGTWSAWRGAIPLATGLPTVSEAYDLVNRAARPPATPVSRAPAPRRRSA